RTVPVRPTGAQAPTRNGKTGQAVEAPAERSQTGDGLAKKPKGLPSMKTPKPAPELSPRAVFRIGLPLHHFRCGPVKGQLRTGEIVWHAGLGNRGGHRAIRTRCEAHHEHRPAGHLPL